MFTLLPLSELDTVYDSSGLPEIHLRSYEGMPR